ncbi:MAG: YjfB family protein [Rhodocyclaceae bacterium]|nr:YjfB family protein [Rhodocyclaceae bacterium]
METSNNLSATQTAMAVEIAVLKKSLDLQAQNAAQLLEALPEPARYNNPPELGGAVDTYA